MDMVWIAMVSDQLHCIQIISYDDPLTYRIGLTAMVVL